MTDIVLDVRPNKHSLQQDIILEVPVFPILRLNQVVLMVVVQIMQEAEANIVPNIPVKLITVMKKLLIPLSDTVIHTTKPKLALNRIAIDQNTKEQTVIIAIFIMESIKKLPGGIIHRAFLIHTDFLLYNFQHQNIHHHIFLPDRM